MLLTENAPGNERHDQFKPDGGTSVSCQGTWAVAADSGPMDLLPILWNRGCLHTYSNISVFSWLPSCGFGQKRHGRT